MQEIYNSFHKSLSRFEEILKAERTIANRDSAIKRFEITVELMWKSLQTFLRDKGFVCRSPKDCLKQAFEYGLISDDVEWFDMIEDRNVTVHTYDETNADEVFDRLPGYLQLLQQLSMKLLSGSET